MIQSMTGFGRGSALSTGKKITVEVKSLNSKQFDISMRVPAYLKEFEIELRNVAAAALQRGKVDLTVTIESTAVEAQTSVNIPLLKEYKEQIEEMSRELGIAAPADWYSVLLRMPDAMKSEVHSAGDSDKEALMAACNEALAQLADFRITEGRKLYNFFKEKIAEIGKLLVEVEPYEAERVPKIRERLEEQLSKLNSIEFDSSRLEQELIFYIEKLDINEEKLRLRSHLNYFLETMGNESDCTGGQGKKLGFIAQEMGREINTLGSKSNNAEMQKIVVKMKDNLEQIKEQVLNVM